MEQQPLNNEGGANMQQACIDIIIVFPAIVDFKKILIRTIIKSIGMINVIF